jgi:hypothetical protein
MARIRPDEIFGQGVSDMSGSEAGTESGWLNLETM